MHDDGTGSLLFHGRKCRINLVGSTHHHGGGDFNARGSACKLDLLLDLFPEWILCVEQNGDPAHGWEHIAEQFDTFPMQRRRHQGYAGDFPPGRFRLVARPSRRDRLTQLQ